MVGEHGRCLYLASSFKDFSSLRRIFKESFRDFSSLRILSPIISFQEFLWKRGIYPCKGTEAKS